ncbi:hypothetical protein [Bacillus wiedmannii]|uniref:hypothetical protein n=1 Tax=Bacillus wiedmannii TaxID=1890302 RepID=UPI000BFCAB8A|nr:hypothetical protein [Bacillus wiedmannii]PHA62846.1 hypothetical protein COE75_16535 [Bacillus wiedmannii]
MKNKIAIAAMSGILVTSLVGLKAYADTRTNVQNPDGSVSTSVSETQYGTSKEATQSEIENKFLNDSYKFSMGPKYIEFDHKVDYKAGEESSAKEGLKNASDFLNELTKNGTDFSAVKSLQENEEWTKFVENISNLKYNVFEKSEVLNDLNNAGALILQAEGHYDEPSLQLLYKLVSELEAGVNGKSVDAELTRTFGKEVKNQIVYKHLQSKL